MRCLWLWPCLLVSAAGAQTPAGWSPFIIGEIDPASPVNCSALNDTPAGQDGFVRIQDGHFVDGRGRRLRFLGTNVTFGDAFPDKALAPRMAARMAALGMNVVRFHHMDHYFRPRGIWDPAFKDRQHLDAEQLDRLDWFIYQLKQHGLYTNLNLHVSRNLGPAEGFASTESFAPYNKGIDNFSARMIELQRNYARDLLTHANPYTKTRYVDEPCVVMVELNNENSLLGFALSGQLGNLPEPYQGELQGLWQDYLRDKYATTEALRRAWDEGSQPLGEELVRNADLAQGTKEWVLESRDPAANPFEVVTDAAVGKALRAQLTKLGVNPWDFQIHQVGHDLQDGQLYTLRFRIRAVPDREVHVGARWDVSDWRGVGLSEKIRATGEWREHVFPFRARDVNPNHTRLSFNAQNTLGEVWLADVSLRPGGVLGLAADQTLERRNIPFTTSSSTRAAQRDFMAFIMELERRYTQGLSDTLKRDLGLKAHVINTQASYGALGGQWRESRLDYLDNHAYWQHPSFPGRPWDPGNWRIGNSPMTDVPGKDTLTALARGRVLGKPYTISEYDHPSPSDYRAEGLPMLAAFGGLQDWDGLFQFDYGPTPADWSQARIGGFFQMVADPAVLAFMPVAAHLFRRGDIQAAEGLAALRVPEGAVADLLAQWRGNVHGMWDQAGLPRETAVRQRVGLQWTPQGAVEADASVPAAMAPLTSDTGELSWREMAPGQWAFLVDTPRTKLAAGRLAGQELRWGPLTVRPTPGATGHCVVALTSLDDQPLEQSKQMLLVAASRVENQNMGWDEKRQSVGRNWGQNPTIVEQVTLECTSKYPVEIATLDGSGRPLPAGARPADGFTLQAPPPWHLISRP